MIPHAKGHRRSPRKTVGGAKLHLESNPLPTRDSWKDQTKPCVHQETPQRLNLICLWLFEYLLWRYRSSVACCLRQGLWVQQTWLWQKPSWRKSPLTPPIFTQDWRNRLLEGTKKTSCAPEPRRKEQSPHKRLTQTCLWVSKSPWQRCVLVVACCSVRGTECGSACMRPFEGGRHFLHYLHHSLVSGQTIGREHSHTHQQKIGLQIYWASE